MAVECGAVLCGLLSSRVAAKRKLHLDAGELDWRDAVGEGQVLAELGGTRG